MRIQSGFQQNSTKEAYGVIRAIRKKCQPRISVIKDENGNILTQREEAVKRWAEYCETLYCDDRMQDERVLCELEEISPPPQEASENSVLIDEIIMAISKLKNNKGVGLMEYQPS